ncbi:hypothetical protein PV05_01100 [Exophiala xenobiotica]|uniref:Amidase domain-containing protein n=1 Tax=Exophiala xenobiotica TaxID=348802 RepID=A0A0D2C7L3_9EURO|nr:uncharacterized protein PV05_01100 [Exophiala xenobiotica]KIW60921.1 hypothetical protein PV05_01100 [Exophiala xenobiotica]
MRWQDAARQAQGQVHAAITSEWKLPKPQAEYLMQDIGSVPRSCGILTEEQLTITEQFSHKTRKETGRGRNLVCTGGRGLLCASCNSTPTAFFPDEGLQRAKELDDHLRRTDKPVGPLHGLPIALKVGDIPPKGPCLVLWTASAHFLPASPSLTRRPDGFL